VSERRRLREIELWIAWVRVGGLAFAVLEVGVFTVRFPPGYLQAAWAVTGAFAFGTLLLLWLAHSERHERLRAVGLASVVFDAAAGAISR